MTHLLGTQDCVESLRRDVIDLQETLVEVFSRTGPVRFRSWKFPDKESCDLDLVQLLEQYDYVEGEDEFNQLSHIVLFELVIDRLILLLQSFNTYTEQMLGRQRAGDCGKAGRSVCVGPVVKRYWKNIIHFSSQQRKQRTSSTSRPEPSSSSRRGSSRTRSDPQISNCTFRGSAAPSSPSRSLRTSPTPSVTTCSASCQTAESTLRPCEACAGVQATLQDSAHAVASLCQALGLSCSLWSFLQTVEETLQLGRLSACDLTLWAREQQRDLGCIQKHITHVQETVESLRHSLKKAEEQRDKLRAQLEREKETNMREREERRRREERERTLREEKCRQDAELQTLQEEKCRRDEELRTLQEEKNRQDEEVRRLQEELRRGAAASEVKISELKGELELLRERQQCLECERDSLVDEVHRLRLEEVRWKETEEKRRNLAVELSDTQKRLDKESAKYHSTQRQHEVMVVKQRSLLERINVLLQQDEELRCRLEEREDEKAELTDTLTHTTQERDALQEQLTQQESEVLSLKEDGEKQCVRLRELEECVSKLTEDLRQAEERERILVAFPELNPTHTKPQSTGDVLCDMEQQLKVNTIRIRVLEQENETLTNTLETLKHTQTITLSQPGAGDQVPRLDAGSSGVNMRARRKEKPSTSSASSASSSSVLHHQTLQLSIVPDAERADMKPRQAARTRSSGMNRWKT